MEPTLVVLVVLVGLVFAWSNGMHDAANAVATSLSTGALTARVALGMSAVLNVLGALLGAGIAELVGTRLIEVPVNRPGPSLVLAALVAALAWNLLTWWAGMPSSSSHALIGALAGAGTAAGARVDWTELGTWVALPMLLSPVLGFVGAWLVMLAALRVFRDAAHGRAIRGFRMAQSVTAATVSVGHGVQDGQKTMGVLVLALGATGAAGVSSSAPDGAVPLWIRLSVAVALGLGTLAGGRRIIRTLARRVVRITPVTGFAAESVASGVLYAAAGLVGVPVSTTHTVTAAIIGAGATGGLRAIRWGTVRVILLVWIATPLCTFAAAGLLLRLGQLLVR
ncbi:MAG: inorganic phosphate transporter [Kineosporiaceae bacterium]